MRENIKVLVVDDDRRMVRTICDILNSKGYETKEAFTGEDALEKVKSDPPDCVLMDIRMPGMNGVEAAKAIGKLAPHLPVVLMSAYATREQVEEACGCGAYSVLAKPIDLQMILSFLSLVGKEETILIVDDDPYFCRTLKKILQARDYRVKTEIDPGKVLGHMERDKGLVVVLDLKLAARDGLDVLKNIRARYPSEPMVLVTGYDGETGASIEKGIQIGAHTFLYKSSEADGLVEMIDTIRRRKLKTALGEQCE